MKYMAIILACAFMGGIIGGIANAEELADVCNSTCMKMRQIADESPFVVAIHTLRVAAEGSPPGSTSALGTGIVIPLEGGVIGILTNNHVIDNPFASRIWVAFHKHGFMREVRIIGRNPAADLALLSAPELPFGVQPAILAKRLELGQQVYALGYAFGTRQPSFGYVNTKASPFSWLYAWTQAPIHPGSSGGPIFNEKHEVVGINTAIISGTTTSFVLPIEYVHRILPRLMREGIVRHGHLGVMVANASHLIPVLFEEQGLKYPPEKDWVMVYDVKPDSSAARAGIKKGDTLLAFNGTPVTNALSLDMNVFFDHHPDESVVLTTRRGIQEFQRTIKLTEYAPLKENK